MEARQSCAVREHLLQSNARVGGIAPRSQLGIEVEELRAPPYHPPPDEQRHDEAGNPLRVGTEVESVGRLGGNGSVAPLVPKRPHFDDRVRGNDRIGQLGNVIIPPNAVGGRLQRLAMRRGRPGQQHDHGHECRCTSGGGNQHVSHGDQGCGVPVR